MKALLIFPHQLFEQHPGFASKPDLVVLSEDPLFFADKLCTINFHRQKLMLHRASMQHFADALRSQGHPVQYFEAVDNNSNLSSVVNSLAEKGVTHVSASDVADYALARRLTLACTESNISLIWLSSPGFINTTDENSTYRGGKKRWFMADFYKWQRQRLDILIDGDNKPVGGKWSFDEENRKKLPKKKLGEIPMLSFAPQGVYSKKAKQYVTEHFPQALGNNTDLLYPVTHSDAQEWLHVFLHSRFAEFGPYEDAIVEDENWLYHSVLTPMLNTGLLTPSQVIKQALEYSTEFNPPLASVEGFIRQVIGWREFMRATYVDLSVPMRTTNHWQHHHKMPDEFYSGATGILPVDNVIKRVLDTGYCHHIERLMVLGGFMFLCEIDPDDIYRWFMELFVDSYDWVMVPNAYAMSQNADGGFITTKPYFSGSNYIRKMSHYPKGEWCDIWDALYWRWIFKQADHLSKNPRWAMMVRTAQRMNEERKEFLLSTADNYLRQLHNL